MMLSVLALCAVTCPGLGSASATVASAGVPPNLVRIYTDGLRTCPGGGTVSASLSPGEEGGAATLPGPDQPGALPTLEEALIGLARLRGEAPLGVTPARASPPAALSASAADGQAGLSVASGERVTLTLTCGGAYAATQFTPLTNTAVRFTFGQPIGHGWRVYVGEAIGVTLNGK